MLKLRKSGIGYLIKFTNWDIIGGQFELAITPQELKALYKLLQKHYFPKTKLNQAHWNYPDETEVIKIKKTK